VKIGGLVRSSLSDYPGVPAAVVFTQGCNFRCPFCHNAGLLASEGATMPEPELWDFLAARRGKLGGVVISGGEPTLQPDLPDVCRRLKALGYRVKLDTNGSRPDVLAALFAEGLVDFVAMDVKAPASGYDRLAGVHAPIARIWESLNLIATCGLPHEFRTTNVAPLLSADDLDAVRAMIPASSPHRVNAFRPELALDPTLREAVV
jgi:pyruvate formate lyase activating enzyme